MIRTYKYRIQINKDCQTKCKNWLDMLRLLYNMALEQRIEYWKHGKSILCSEQCKELICLRKEFSDYGEIGSHVIRDPLMRVDKAYQGFFRRVKQGLRPGFPRFKGKDRFNSFTFPDRAGWKLVDRYLYLTNIGRVKVILSRPITGNIKTVTIKRSSTNKWYVCFCCDNVEKKEYTDTNKEVGIDVGISSFLTDSTGRKIENYRFLKKSSKVLRVRSRKLTRRKRGSNRWNKARVLVASIHEKVVNQRNDFLHKISTEYIQNYKNIAVENLVVKNMVKNRHLSKSIYDVSWSRFFDYLLYKAEEAGREVVKVCPKNTSQVCSGCGKIVKKTLAERTHACSYCGLVMDRDENAAKNILNKSAQFVPSGDNAASIQLHT